MTSKNSKWNLLIAAAALAAGAQAGTALADHGDASVTRFPGFSPSLLAALGGPIGVENVVELFYEHVDHDSRVHASLFGDTPKGKLQEDQKKALLQTLLGTPSLAEGTSHEGVRQLTDTEYNALTEDLYDALEEARVPYHTSNRVMATLGPYQPSLISAYLNSTPSVQRGEIRVGPVQPQ